MTHEILGPLTKLTNDVIQDYSDESNKIKLEVNEHY